MVLKTTRKITLEEAKEFEDQQGERGIKKLNIFYRDPCFWTVNIDNPSMFNQFRANVVWKQIQPSPLGEIYDSYTEIFREEFVLDSGETQLLWEELNTQILSTDNLTEALGDILYQGVVLWITQKREIFGLLPNELERLDN